MPGFQAIPKASTSNEGGATKSRLLKYTGHNRLRYRLVLSLLSRRPVRIDNIRSDDDEPGLREYEITFLRLMERISNGTVVEISYTGTSILFSPGTLLGGAHTVNCPLSRSIGWFLEPLLPLAPFCKKPLVLTLTGITTDGKDASVDTLRLSCLPHLALCLPSSEGLELRIAKRGHPPSGGGEVTFRCPTIKQLKPGLDFVKPGQVQKIRGVAHSLRVSPQFSNRLVSAARGVLNRFIPDIYIYTDVFKGDESGKSPGYALTLLSTSTTSVLHSAEATSSSPTIEEQQTPEDLGIAAARSLISEIARGGSIDRGNEVLISTLMTLGREGDVVRCLIGGPLEASLIQHLRDLRDFTGVTFKIKEPTDITGAEVYQLACVPFGFAAVAAKTS